MLERVPKQELLTPRDEPGAFKKFIERDDVNAAVLESKQLEGITHDIRGSWIPGT